MIRLRPVEPADAGVLERRHGGLDEAGPYGWFGYKNPGTLRRRLEAGEAIGEDRGMLAVVDGEQVVGDVSWVRLHNGPPPNGACWNVGIWLAPEFRGRGIGAQAQRLLCEYLFEHTTMERIEAGTEVDNIGEQRSLEKAGFTREGVLRRACFRGGQWRDMVLYSKLRGEQ